MADQITTREQALLAERLAAPATAVRPGAIPRRPEGAPAPLSFAQTRLWFFDRLMPGSPLYNIAFSAPIRFAIDVRVLREAIRVIVDRHEVLRTVFAQDGEDPVQVVRPSVTVPIQAVDLRRLPAERREAELVRLAARFQDEPFDLSQGPLLRVMVAWLAPRRYLLVIVVHHVAADGWSLGILARELEAAYQALARHRPPALPPLEIQYADFAAWQRERLRGDVLAAEVDHWRQRLADLPVQDLPTDRPRPPVQMHRGADLAFTVPAPLVERLTMLARSRRATLFMVLLAAFDVVLGRWAGQREVVVGAPIANRNRPEIEGLIGFFVNTLVLRVDLSSSPTFAEVIDRVRAVALDAYAHQDLPFEKLVEELAPERDLSRNPLVQVIFQLFESGAHPDASALQAGLSLPSRTSLFDLRVDLAPGPAGLAGRVEYDIDLFERPTIERLVHRYLRLLDQVAAAPDRPIAGYDLLGDDERGELVVVGGGRRVPVSVGWLGEVGARRGAGVAVVDGVGGRLSWGELEARSRGVAGWLRSRGAGRGSLVAVAVPRDVGLAVAVLGVLRAGAAFLPLDADLPVERREFMLHDSGACLVLGDADRHRDAGELALPAGEDLAWVLYTSGSSGRPKGVAGTHRGLANRIAWGRRAQPFAGDDIACAKSRLGFVDSICELLAPLAAGVPVVIADEPSLSDPLRLAELLVRERVTRVVLVPSLLRVLLDSAPDALARSALRLITASGEPLTAADVRALRRVLPACELWNIYGSTEVAADATAHKVTRLDSDRVPIGRPLDNVTVELCDPTGEPVPLGAIGEIVIGGAGVSPGYIGHARTENHRFTADQRYRTGDLGRWRADRTLEHHGRADRQLKIRGARVEPDELEHALKALPDIADAAATSHPTPHGPVLAAYYTTTAPTTPDSIRAHLQHTLPTHLIPTHLTELPDLPHLPNGKLDRQTLSQMQPEIPGSAAVHDPPETPEERAVADVFAELTGAAQVGRQDDFFALGGHSLLATRAVSRLGERLGKAIELRLVFEHRTVAGLAAAVAALETSEAAATRIERVDRERFRMG